MSSFVENILKLVTGSIAAQSVIVITTPVITRLYTPEVFGVAALFTSVISIIAILSSFRYDQAIMLPKNDGHAANLLGLSVCFIILVSAVTALILLLTGNFINTYINSPDFNNFLWLIPIGIFAAGIFNPFKLWSSRFKNFGSISIAQVMAALTAQGSKLAAGFAGYSSSGALILSYLLGLFISPLVIGSQIWKKQKHIFQSQVTWEKMFFGLKRYRDFPLYSTWSTLFNSASTHLPTIILAFYFSPAVVGYYALGKAVLKIPISLIGGAVAQVFYQKASDTRSRSESLKPVVEKVFNRLVSLGMLPICMLIVISKDVFVIAFGEQWIQAGVYVQILALWIFFQFITSPITTLFFVLEKQGVGLAFNILLLGTRVASLIIGGLTGNIIFTLYLFMLTGVTCYGLLSIYLIAQVGISLRSSLFTLVKYLLNSIPFMALIVLAKEIWGIQEVGTLVMSFFFLIVYYLFILTHDTELRKKSIAMLKRFDLF